MSGKKWFAAWVLMAACALRADTVFLTNGVEINGEIVHQDDQTIVVRVASGKTRSIRSADVDTIIREKTKPKEAAVAPATQTPTETLAPSAIKSEPTPVRI